jgi:hypothetical protein
MINPLSQLRLWARFYGDVSVVVPVTSYSVW